MSRMLCVDPGETAGWSLWKDNKLLGGGQTPLWPFAHAFADVCEDNIGPLAEGEDDCLREGVEAADNSGPIDLIVIETFALYPWEAKNLHWDEFRTVQLIGALQLTAVRNNVKVEKQPALIKERAKAGGVDELFVRPLHENRHQNDSIMHGWYYLQMEKRKTI